MSCRPLFTIELGVHLKSVGLLWWTFDDVSYWLGNWYFGKSWKWACSNYTFVSRDWVEWMLIHALWFTRCLSFPYRLQVGASCFLLHLSAFCTVFMDRSIWFNLCVFFSFWPLRLFDYLLFLVDGKIDWIWNKAVWYGIISYGRGNPAHTYYTHNVYIHTRCNQFHAKGNNKFNFSAPSAIAFSFCQIWNFSSFTWWGSHFVEKKAD